MMYISDVWEKGKGANIIDYYAKVHEVVNKVIFQSLSNWVNVDIFNEISVVVAVYKIVGNIIWVAKTCRWLI